MNMDRDKKLAMTFGLTGAILIVLYSVIFKTEVILKNKR